MATFHKRPKSLLFPPFLSLSFLPGHIQLGPSLVVRSMWVVVPGTVKPGQVGIPLEKRPAHSWVETPTRQGWGCKIMEAQQELRQNLAAGATWAGSTVTYVGCRLAQISPKMLLGHSSPPSSFSSENRSMYFKLVGTEREDL